MDEDTICDCDNCILSRAVGRLVNAAVIDAAAHGVHPLAHLFVTCCAVAERMGMSPRDFAGNARGQYEAWLEMCEANEGPPQALLETIEFEPGTVVVLFMGRDEEPGEDIPPDMH
jgi:hypothetical protein